MLIHVIVPIVMHLMLQVNGEAYNWLKKNKNTPAISESLVNFGKIDVSFYLNSGHGKIKLCMYKPSNSSL